jgi:hypothetical protein
MATQRNASKNSGGGQQRAETDDDGNLHFGSSCFVPVMFISAGLRCDQAKTAGLQLPVRNI